MVERWLHTGLENFSVHGAPLGAEGRPAFGLIAALFSAAERELVGLFVLASPLVAIGVVLGSRSRRDHCDEHTGEAGEAGNSSDEQRLP